MNPALSYQTCRLVGCAILDAGKNKERERLAKLGQDETAKKEQREKLAL
jgi:hypothetical protein